MAAARPRTSAPPPLQAAATTTAQVKPNSYRPPGPIGNTTGLIVPDTAPNPTLNAAPAITPTKKEEGWWKRWGSDVVHGVLDVAGFVPVLGAIPDVINAGVYAAEGNAVQAGISLVAAIPGAGDAVAAGNIGVKVGTKIAKETAEQAEKRLTKEAAEKLEKEAAEKAANAKKEAAADKGGKDEPKKKRRKGPCDHLKKGDANGKGSYRGGSYGGTTQKGIESHHAPANSTSPLPKSQGTAVQMDPLDHKGTSSHGHQGADGAMYRAEIEQMPKDGRWRDALAQELKDIRRVARDANDPKKYNEAIKEMLEYFKCLEKHGLLPSV